MPSHRRLKIETVLAVVVPHLFLVNIVMPQLAQWMPTLALADANSAVVPSVSKLRLIPVGADLTNPGLWVYLLLLWLCFGVWAYLRRKALHKWGEQLFTDSKLDA